MDIENLDLIVTLSFGFGAAVGEWLRLSVHHSINKDLDKKVRIKYEIKKQSSLFKYYFEPYLISVALLFATTIILIIGTVEKILSIVLAASVFGFVWGMSFGASHCLFDLVSYRAMKKIIKEQGTIADDGAFRVTSIFDDDANKEIRRDRAERYISKNHEDRFRNVMRKYHELELRSIPFWFAMGIFYLSVIVMLANI